MSNELFVSNRSSQRSRDSTYVDLKKVSHEEIVVHGVCDDLGHGLRSHLDVGIVTGSTGLGSVLPDVSAEITYLPVPGKTDFGDISKLGEVLLHLVLVETVRDSTNEKGSCLGILLISSDTSNQRAD